ncbi:MAG: hypothetical protein HYX51_09525 [Chloroflexi bacterium]|nr:hypothetical protein [Chloroflexota bacterium]
MTQVLLPRRFATAAAGARVRPSVDALALAGALVVGLVVRLRYVLAADFPLNDGGLFYVMTRELARSHYRLPEFTSYNGAGIPFAYPPLGFYAAALLAAVTRASLLDVFRFLPLAINLATICAFFLLARTFVKSSLVVAVASFAFVVQPESFIWQIMGGGLTRSFGFLFALLAIRQTYLLFTRDARRDIPLTVLLCGMTVLSHLEAAYFVVVTALVLLVAHGRGRAGIVRAVIVAGGVAAVTAPWWVTVLAYHGVAPFVAARGSAAFSGAPVQLGSLVMFSFTKEPFFPVIAALALAGVYMAWLRRQPLLPCWLIVLWVLDPRGGHNYVTVPLALLAGLGVTDVVLPLWRQFRAGMPAVGPVSGRSTRGSPSDLAGALPVGLIGVLLIYGVLSAIMSAPVSLGAVPADERDAMAWIDTHTPSESSFLVVDGIGWDVIYGSGAGMDALTGWGLDRSSEWFPVLANRPSVATPQGYEWLPDVQQAERLYYEAQKCAVRDAACLDAWVEQSGRSFTHVYIPKQPVPPASVRDPEGCCWALRHALRTDSRYRTVYDGPGASVFERVRE